MRGDEGGGTHLVSVDGVVDDRPCATRAVQNEGGEPADCPPCRSTPPQQHPRVNGEP